MKPAPMCTVPLLLLLGTVLGPAPGHAQAENAHLEQIYEVLEYSKLDAVTGDFVDAFLAQVESLLPAPLSDEDSGRLAESVKGDFSYDSVRVYVAEAMLERSDPEVVQELLGWLPSGASAEIDELVGDSEPAVDLETYAQSLQANPPPEARIQLVAEWASVQAAGDFYALLLDAQIYAAHRIAGALSADAPAYEPPTPEQLQQYAMGGFNVAVLSFLQRLESIDETLIRSAIEQFSSDSGQWFVEAYSYALGDAIRIAGEHAAARLSP